MDSYFGKPGLVKVICRRTGEGLLPADSYQAESLQQIPLGSIIAVDVRKDRNPAFHRKFMAMIRATFEMQDTYETMRQWRAVVTCGAGFCTWSKDEAGNLVAVPESISFESMDELEFRGLYTDCVRYIESNHINSTEELLELLEYV